MANTTWQDEWKQLYTADPQSLEPFFFWLGVKKLATPEDVQDFDLDNDKHFRLLERYGNDPEIYQLSQDCQKERGI